MLYQRSTPIPYVTQRRGQCWKEKVDFLNFIHYRSVKNSLIYPTHLYIEMEALFASDSRFASLDMTEFLARTVPETQVIYCMYHQQNCQQGWKFKLTLNGYCIVFNNDTQTEPAPKISVGRQTSLTLMLGFK